MGQYLQALPTSLRFRVCKNLGDNNLSGPIPDSLNNLHSLKELNLENNNLEGSVPEALLARMRQEQLQLRISGNPHLKCISSDCDNKSKGRIKLIVGVATPVSFVALIAIAMFVYKKRQPKRKEHPRRHKAGGCLSFSYSEVIEMTSNFETRIGVGGYGPVFHGRLPDGRQVAVKILSDKSKQGDLEFSTEVDLLSRVHHKYVVPFIGYCDASTHKILIYEYMSSGNLRDLLSGKLQIICYVVHGQAYGKSAPEMPLDWERRLRIALNAAQGLEYLHTGCTPAIIHRDIKSANILLNDKMEAKIADFGLSKARPSDEATHSPVITQSSGDKMHIVSWVHQMLSNENMEGVVKQTLVGNHTREALRKVTELAMACTEPYSIRRPTISKVVEELREAIRLQIAAEYPSNVNWNRDAQLLSSPNSLTASTTASDQYSSNRLSGPR
eukprot:Gb_41613 [translate_table: standard]